MAWSQVHECTLMIVIVCMGFERSVIHPVLRSLFIVFSAFPGITLSFKILIGHLFRSTSISTRLPKLNSPLATLENESLPSLSFLVCPEEKGDRNENQERLNIRVIARLDSLSLPVVGALRFRSGKKVTKQLRNRRLSEDEDDKDGWCSEDSSSRSGLKKR
jgi:hypothetical protein